MNRIRIFLCGLFVVALGALGLGFAQPAQALTNSGCENTSGYIFGSQYVWHAGTAYFYRVWFTSYTGRQCYFDWRVNGAPANCLAVTSNNGTTLRVYC